MDFSPLVGWNNGAFWDKWHLRFGDISQCRWSLFIKVTCCHFLVAALVFPWKCASLVCQIEYSECHLHADHLLTRVRTEVGNSRQRPDVPQTSDPDAWGRSAPCGHLWIRSPGSLPLCSQGPWTSLPGLICNLFVGVHNVPPQCLPHQVVELSETMCVKVAYNHCEALFIPAGCTEWTGDPETF